MECIRHTSQWSANWPGAYFYLSMPGLFTIGLYYLVLVTVLTGWLFRGDRRVWKITGLAVLMSIWCGLWLSERPATRVTILPFNNGHAVYLESSRNSGDWLIDCGNDSSVDMVVKPFLRAHGVNRLANFALTHGEMPYTGGANSIVTLFSPKNIYLSSIHFRSPEYTKFEIIMAANTALRHPLHSGDHLGPWTVLHPDSSTHFPKASDNTLVLRAEINGVRLLLCSDLGHPGQNALFDHHDTNDLRADIVVAGMPAENEPLGEALLDAIQPRVIVIADSSVKRAGENFRERLARRNIPVFYTVESDAVTLTLRNGRWQASGMEGKRVETNVDDHATGTK
jgi:beta-lactamase superfamily II metal-dependent hydrolase